MTQRCECNIMSISHTANWCEGVGGLKQYHRLSTEEDSLFLWLCWDCCLSGDQELFKDDPFFCVAEEDEDDD